MVAANLISRKRKKKKPSHSWIFLSFIGGSPRFCWGKFKGKSPLASGDKITLIVMGAVGADERAGIWGYDSRLVADMVRNFASTMFALNGKKKSWVMGWYYVGKWEVVLWGHDVHAWWRERRKDMGREGEVWFGLSFGFELIFDYWVMGPIKIIITITNNNK